MNKKIQNTLALLALAVLAIAEYPEFSEYKPYEAKHVPEGGFWYDYFPVSVMAVNSSFTTFAVEPSYVSAIHK